MRDEIRSVILEASFGNGIKFYTINLYVQNELKKINLEQGRSNKSIIPDYNYRLIIFSKWELLFSVLIVCLPSASPDALI